MIINSDCIDGMRMFPDNYFDSVVTDPPYELGFMGKTWDASGIAYSVEMWREVLRVLKPGGHMLAFSGSRTYHRMVCAIEDAGFEVRDQIMWIYGSGFPKSLDVSKAIDKAAGAERGTAYLAHGGNKVFGEGKGKAAGVDRTPGAQLSEPAVTPAAQKWQGWGTALKPAHEPICVARKPLAEGTVAANVLEWGTGAVNIDACRVDTMGGMTWETPRGGIWATDSAASAKLVPNEQGRWPANLILSYDEDEFALRSDATPEQLRELQEWMNANPEL